LNLLRTRAQHSERSLRIRSSLLAMGCALASYLLLGGVFASVGSNYEGQLRLLEPYRAPTSDEAIAVIPIEYALATSDVNDVLFVGDSACRSGLDPLLFESVSGLKAYNLGSFGGLGIAAHMVTLKAYLAHHAKPRAVVLCLSPLGILRVRSDPDPNIATLATTTAGTLYERFLRVYGSPSQRRSIFADGTVSLRYFINRGMAISKSTCTTQFTGQRHDLLDEPLYGFTAETYKTLRDRTVKKRGFCPLSGQHGDGVTSLEALDEPHSVVSWIDDGVREIAGLAHSNHFRLLIRLAPISATQAPWDREGIPAWLTGLKADFPDVSVSRPEIMWYDPKFCWDSIHLNRQGVERFTAQTARDVAAILEPVKMTTRGIEQAESVKTINCPGQKLLLELVAPARR
jgi:hypothetical protein